MTDDQMSATEFVVTFEPIIDLSDRWDISMDEAEVFLEHVGYFNSEQYREVADHFGPTEPSSDRP